jgi:endonuclease/exonuclease/phosphatase family metal-dependent hydrolase
MSGEREMPEELVSAYGTLIESRLRVLSWNLWARFGPWEARQPAILATIAALDPDIACLQEAWSAPESSMAALVAERLGFQHAYSCNDEGPVHSGNAIVSRWPILRTSWRPLPAEGEPDERRTVLFAEIDGPRGAIQVFCTHLNWRFDHSAVRQAQVRLIGGFVDECRPRDYPPILTGDMNAAPDSDEIRILTGRTAVAAPKLVFHDAWEVAGEGPGMTWSNDNPYAALDLEPTRRIDYVFAGWPKGGGRGHIVRAEVIGRDPIGGVVPSDHYGVVAELRY